MSCITENLSVEQIHLCQTKPVLTKENNVFISFLKIQYQSYIGNCIIIYHLLQNAE